MTNLNEIDTLKSAQELPSVSDAIDFTLLEESALPKNDKYSSSFNN